MPKLVINMTIKSISAPYNAGHTVEVLWESEKEVGRARVFRAEFDVAECSALGLAVGQVYAVPFYRLEPVFTQAQVVRKPTL